MLNHMSVVNETMDVERQDRNQLKEDLSIGKIKNHVKEKVNRPTVTATLIVFFILNVIMLIVGFMHINHCTIRKMIPIYLIVAGAVGIVSKLLPFINRKLDMKAITIIIYVLYIFEFIWTIIGSYWVYSTNNINFDKGRPPFEKYCDKTAYYLAFWLLTVNWIFIAFTVIVICGACICIACMSE